MAHHFSQLPAVRALGAGEQAAQIGAGVVAQIGRAEVRSEPRVQGIQVPGPGVSELLINGLRHPVLLRRSTMMPPHAL
jgi:hypothetical protein